MGNQFGGKQDQQWFEDEFLMPMGCAGPGGCCAEAVGITYKVLMVGLDNAGKTTLCLHLMGRQDEKPVRTGAEQAIYDNRMSKERTANWILPLSGGDDVTLHICDVGGRSEYRALWGYMYRGVTAVIFVVDGCDRARLIEARNALFEHVLTHVEAGQLPLIVIAHDKLGQEPMSDAEVLAGLGVLGCAGDGVAAEAAAEAAAPQPVDSGAEEAPPQVAAGVAAALTLVWHAHASLPDIDVRRMRMISGAQQQLLPPKERFHFARVRPGDGAALWQAIRVMKERIEQNIDRLATHPVAGNITSVA
eukprot:TRINITY_DN16145_c0_g1_i1.p1 TRINITY_DN16145_c0_g1~~TRINITY_DN16145_c0_g1_i1.p1  ORF type:complete len:332 (+),score=104.98 TRINITY_DN16145_c0_g1_i1:86-997(+)